MKIENKLDLKKNRNLTKNKKLLKLRLKCRLPKKTNIKRYC